LPMDRAGRHQSSAMTYKRRDELRATLPIRRVIGPADVAALAVHIMSNTALTGATYDIDGSQQLLSSAADDKDRAYASLRWVVSDDWNEPQREGVISFRPPPLWTHPYFSGRR